MKRLILLVAVAAMVINVAQAQDSTIMAQAYRDSVHQAKVTRNRALAATQKAERKSLRTFEANQPFKTKFTLGFNAIVEAQVDLIQSYVGNVTPNFGIPFEIQFTRHSGLETGLYYRNLTYKIPQNSWGVYITENQRYLSLPILYKFHSRILNFSIGFNIDYMVSHSIMWVDDDGNDKNRLLVGVLCKLSKELVLVKGLIFEPSLHFNPYIDVSGSPSRLAWLGGTIGIKYRF